MKEKFNQKIGKEMCKFRANIIKLDKEKIYESYNKIKFFEECYDYLAQPWVHLEEDELKICLKVENFIESLYNYYNDFYIDNAIIEDYCDLVDEFIELISGVEENE